MRLGLMGGTFDPVHVGHLVVAEVARAEFALDRVIWIPAGAPPHKLGEPAASPEDRYAMVVLATATNPAFEVSRVELERSGVSYAIDTIRELAGSGLPTFGICLGHQLIGLAFGGDTAKLPYGHRGGNHPVRDLRTGQVLITTQNHGFAVVGDADGVPGASGLEVTHLNLNDGTIEGVRHRELPLFAVQYHPEASPGPHDAFPHFEEFLATLPQAASRKPSP